MSLRISNTFLRASIKQIQSVCDIQQPAVSLDWEPSLESIKRSRGLDAVYDGQFWEFVDEKLGGIEAM